MDLSELSAGLNVKAVFTKIAIMSMDWKKS